MHAPLAFYRTQAYSAPHTAPPIPPSPYAAVPRPHSRQGSRTSLDRQQGTSFSIQPSTSSTFTSGVLPSRAFLNPLKPGGGGAGGTTGSARGRSGTNRDSIVVGSGGRSCSEGAQRDEMGEEVSLSSHDPLDRPRYNSKISPLTYTYDCFPLRLCA